MIVIVIVIVIGDGDGDDDDDSKNNNNWNWYSAIFYDEQDQMRSKFDKMIKNE